MCSSDLILRDGDDLVGDAERFDVASQSVEKGGRLAQAFKSGNDDAEFRLGHRQRGNYRDGSVVSKSRRPGGMVLAATGVGDA